MTVLSQSLYKIRGKLHNLNPKQIYPTRVSQICVPLGTSTSSSNRTDSNIEYRYIGQYSRVSHDALELYKANTSTFDPCVLKGVPDRTSNPDYSFCICTSSPYQTLGFYEKRTIVCCSSLRYSILEK